MEGRHYDIAIIGAGASGLQLALALSRDRYFDSSKIVVVEKDLKTENDKTWCFWEEGIGKWDSIIHKSWRKASFHGPNQDFSLDLSPFKYKMVRSVDFYDYAKKKVQQAPNIDWIIDEVNGITEKRTTAEFDTKNGVYTSDLCFDSRIPFELFDEAKNSNDHVYLAQHFKGKLVRFENDVFNPESFTMMDFRMPFKDSMSFMYILPMSENTAMLEFTFFSNLKVSDMEYDSCIEAYIQRFLKEGGSYEVLESESGLIPMTNFPFHRFSSNKIIKIGTAGSWVRPSTGYSFKSTEEYVRKLIANIKLGKPANHKIHNTKYWFYDTLMLDILERRNTEGALFFERMYNKNSPELIFKFLGGQTSFLQDLKVMSSFNPLPFMKSIVRRYLGIRF